jgi:hypothetical protein
MNALLRKIEIFRGLNSSAVEAPETIEVEITPADHYDLRFLSKKEITKMSVETLESLVRYGEEYLETYASGQFLYKKNKRQGMQVADLAEAGAHGQISRNILLLKQELCKRG